MTISDRFANLSPLKRALLAIDELKARLDASERARAEPIAIIGLSCRFPGAANADEAWSLLRDGGCAVREVPADRWNIDALYDPDPTVPGRMVARSAGFLDRIDGFDAPFFGIAPREAASMDPQQRLFLEVAWEALEDAAIAPDGLAGSATGVYAGVASSDYAELMKASSPASMDGHFASGVAHSILSGRLAYILGLQGPAVSVDTACSSSLVAVHLACQGLRQGDCRVAIAGGVSLMITPDNSILFSKALMLAPDGRCKTFDAAADGFGRGEGCGVVVLKRLSEAIADGDRVTAIIRASAVNQDGPSSGLTAPNGPAQEAVIREALERASLEPSAIDFVEAHGTGTALGDPIEVQALGAVHAERPVDRPLAIGSIKTNVGHLEGAAGVAGLIKLVLSLQHAAIPPHLHLQRLNPHVEWDDLRLTVPTVLTPWRRGERPRIGAVSAFGFSGTNAHVIVEEGPPHSERNVAPERPLHVVALSARSDEALEARARDLLNALPDTGAALPDVAFSENAGRAHFAHRLVLVAADREQLATQIEGVLDGRTVPGARRGKAATSEPLRAAFLFTGQGAQYAEMGRELYETHPEFRRTIDTCDDILKAHLDRSLLSVVYPAAGVATPIDETAYTQPALFALDYALAQLWRSWGIEPSFVIGHSLGEFVAACVAGVFSLEDGLALVASRGRLMQALPRDGEMASVFAPEERVLAAIAPYADRVSIAAINDPKQTVISGERGGIDAILRAFAAENVQARRLTVSHAFHSPLMSPMLDPFGDALARVSFAPPRCGFVSNVTGKVVAASEICRPDYWLRHVMSPVRFAASIDSVVAQGARIFIEAGPHPTLLGMASRCVDGDDFSWLPSLRKERGNWSQLLESVSSLYLRGAKLDWPGFDRVYGRRRIALPTYPFERERCWIDTSHVQAPTARSEAPAIHPLLERRVRVHNYGADVFETIVTPGTHRWIFDHRVHGSVIVPGAAFVEMAFAAARATWGDGPHGVESLAIHQALAVDEAGPTTIQVVVRGDDEGAATVQIYTVPDDESPNRSWPLHAEARIVRGATADAVPAILGTVKASQERCAGSLDPEIYYRSLEARGLDLGPAFRGLLDVHTGGGTALARIALPASADVGAYCVHPVLLDLAIQTLGGAILADDIGSGDASYLPLTVERARWNPDAGPAVWAQASPREPLTHGAESIVADVMLRDGAGSVVASIEGLRLKRVDPNAWRHGAATGDGIYEVRWDVQPPIAARGSSDFAPLPAVASAMADRVPAIVAAHGLDRFEDALPDLEALAASYVVRAFRSLGVRFDVGDSLTPAVLAQTGRVVEAQRRLFERLFEILGESGVLRRQAQDWVVARTPAHDDADERLDALDRLAGDVVAAELALLRRCGPELAGVLRGTADPLALLFPNGSAQLAENLYQASPAARAFNQLLAESVQRALAGAAADRPLRVLEIGGGTGSTSSFVLPFLPADRTDYLFTDVSPAFTSRAAKRFAKYPFVRCQPLDIERNPASQGLADERFNVIVAANVLHATRDLGETFAHVRQLLAPGGLLVLLEMVAPQRWIDLTFGLTDGWWRFTDRELRPSYPLLSLAGWRRFLAGQGFEDVQAVPGVESDGLLGIESAIFARGPRAPVSPREWLVLADAAGNGRKLAGELQAAGERCTVVTAGANANDTLRTALPAFFSEGSGAKGVVHLWALDAGREAIQSLDALRAAEAALCGTALQMVQLAAQSGRDVALTFVTRGAQPVISGEGADPVQAPLWGFGKVVALEHPELRPLRIDLDPGADGIAGLADELREPRSEDQVAIRAGQRYVPRFVPRPEVPVASASGIPTIYRLEIPERGSFDRLRLTPTARRAAAAGEVEIRVRTTALNFRDVMNVLGMYPGDPGPLGNECAGTVVGVGDGVDGLREGDEVVALAPGSFASYVTAPATFVVPRPATLDPEEAVTAPIAYLTAYFALHHLAGVRAGESVLIHAAAGGVGLAAVHLARRAGADVFATAGTPEKRAYLESIGVRHVMSSRTTDFSAEILARTNGRGVDVVLNSLAGDFIAPTFAALASGGRFLEIGKSGWTRDRVEALGRGHVFHVIDWSAEARSDPALIRGMLTEIVGLVASGALPPLPRRAFDIDAVVDAFRFMAQGRHIGKVLVNHPEAFADVLVRADASYLVTGGLSGLGLLTASWLADRGATRLILMGRREPSAEARDVLDGMRARGVEIAVVQGDAAKEADVVRAVAQALPERPLRGIVHSAGVLDDGAIVQQNWTRFETVMAPKMFAAWHLDRLTRGLPLDFFVSYSSIAATFGSRGQANHAAANAYLDALAHARRAAGLPGLSINWGVWTEVGAAVRHGVDKRAEGQGIGSILPSRGLAVLEQLMRDGARQATVCPIDWQRYAAQLPAGARPAFLTEVLPRTVARPKQPAARQSGGQPEFLRLLEATPLDARARTIATHVREQVVRVLALPATRQLDARQPLSEVGLDSLMAVELRNVLSGSLGRPLPATLLFDYPTVEALAGYLSEQLLGAAPASAPGPATPAAVDGAEVVAAIEDLSDEEVDRLLAERMARRHES